MRGGNRIEMNVKSRSTKVKQTLKLKTNMKGAHPKSDVNIGKINEINSEYETLAVVNQIRALDKLRIYRVQNIKSKQTGIVQSKLNMKLTDQQLEKLIKAIANYLNSNGGDL